jgi:hypothetical protein
MGIEEAIQSGIEEAIQSNPESRCPERIVKGNNHGGF